MGCDIHFHTEVKVNGRWEHYSHPRIQRNYRLFHLLAGVRTSGNEEFEPFKLGLDNSPHVLPKDLNILTEKSMFDGRAQHSYCMYDAQEINDFYERIKDLMLYPQFDKEPLHLKFEWEYVGYLEGNGWDIIKYPESKPEWVEDIRWVMGFDN